MNHGAESTSPELNAHDKAHQDAFVLYRAALARRPFGAGVGLFVEYATFAAGLFLALLLFITRVPLRVIDRRLGLRLRERCVNLLARISPG